ncbi:MAG: hypothetical protein EG822_18130 [Deltaproteobacteria bacterium]|nr:hypothetical protein [Deltaproteobacteria bacterium]TLN00716.1 MAG: hypothetical protein FDZ73_18490 [bacterium]
MAATEVRSVDFALKNGIAADLYVDTSDLGRFVIEEETLISGGGSVSALETDFGCSAQTVRFQRRGKDWSHSL